MNQNHKRNIYMYAQILFTTNWSSSMINLYHRNTFCARPRWGNIAIIVKFNTSIRNQIRRHCRTRIENGKQETTSRQVWKEESDLIFPRIGWGDEALFFTNTRIGVGIKTLKPSKTSFYRGYK